MGADETRPNAAKRQVVSAVNGYEPLPLDCLPQPARDFVSAVAESVGTDPACAALPLLAALGAAIGTSCRAVVKPGWCEYGLLWTCLVGESGSGKTPAAAAVLAATEEQERRAAGEYGQAMRQYETDRLEYERLLAEWKRKKGGGDPPAKPAESVCQRYIVSDTTIEALAAILAANPRGVLLYRDELAGWLSSFARYKSASQATDLPAWLSIHSTGPVRVDRKTGAVKTLYVPRSFVAITGSIQPRALRRALGPEFFDCGLPARMLLAMPPRRPRQWRDSSVPDALARAMGDVFTALWQLNHATDEEGNLVPVDVPFDKEAAGAFRQFVNEHGREQYEETSGDLASLWSKLEATAARFALIFHLTRWAAGDSSLPDPNRIDPASIAAGVKLVRWFGSEARRIYRVLDETEEDEARRELAELVGQQGGEVTPRDLMRVSRRFPDAETAEAALTDLAERGAGAWFHVETTPRGGRPTTVFRLDSMPTVDTTHEKARKTGVLSTVSSPNGHLTEVGP
jgi:hypothetical protein